MSTVSPGALRHQMRVYARHVLEFDQNYLSRDADAKSTQWRPIRIAVRDRVLGVFVLRHNRNSNLLEVDVCLCDNHPSFPPHSGARLVALSLIAEAYRSGGRLEIHFTKNVEKAKDVKDHGRVPASIYEMALELGVRLNHVVEGVVTQHEARQLFLAATEFSEVAQQKIMQLDVEDKVRAERVCFMVNNGLWDKWEMEQLLLSSNTPETALLGPYLPEMGLLYEYDLLIARSALLGGYLDRRMENRARHEGDEVFEIEGDIRRLNITFDPRFHAKVIVCDDEDVDLPWSVQGDAILHAGHRLVTLIRSRNTVGYRQTFLTDIELVNQARKLYDEDGIPTVYAILVTRDFEDLEFMDKTLISQYANAAKKAGVHLMVCPETNFILDGEAEKRFQRSRILRR
jgi:hypothetical protein